MHDTQFVNTEALLAAPVKRSEENAAAAGANSPEGGAQGDRPSSSEATWTFLSNHTHVLVCLASDPMQTLREVATKVGITERAVLRIVADLEAGGVLRRERQGRRNRYVLDLDVRLRHDLERHCRIGDLLRLVLGQ